MRTVFWIIALLTLIGCKEISFKEPQPAGKKSLRTIPKNIQGKYLTLKENGEFSNDTIIIHSTGYRFGYFDPAERNRTHDEQYEEGVLSDSLVLKTYKGYYFFNFHENPEWILRVVQPQKNGDLIYMAPEQEGVDFKDYIRELSAEIKIDSFEVERTMLYQIHPTASQLVTLIEKGYFSRATLKKIL